MKRIRLNRIISFTTNRRITYGKPINKQNY